jgi:hypothetical protein
MKITRILNIGFIVVKWVLSRTMFFVRVRVNQVTMDILYNERAIKFSGQVEELRSLYLALGHAAAFRFSYHSGAYRFRWDKSGRPERQSIVAINEQGDGYFVLEWQDKIRIGQLDIEKMETQALIEYWESDYFYQHNDNSRGASIHFDDLAHYYLTPENGYRPLFTVQRVSSIDFTYVEDDENKIRFISVPYFP